MDANHYQMQTLVPVSERFLSFQKQLALPCHTLRRAKLLA